MLMSNGDKEGLESGGTHDTDSLTAGFSSLWLLRDGTQQEGQEREG